LIIGVQNLSTLVSGMDAYNMTLLVNKQLREHVAPAWGIQPPEAVFLPQGGAGNRYSAIIGIMDDADQAGDLGWHTEGPDASIYGRVFARPVLSNGGNALTASLSVCSVLSHEAIEVLGDATCNGWRQRADGTLVATELADPVESDSYLDTIEAEGTSPVLQGTVSNFVFPRWFDPDAPPITGSGGYFGNPLGFDYMGMLTSPFEVRPSGYVITMSGGTVSAQWGEEYPAWRRATKETPLSRTARRRDTYPLT
jgi:hypothetical protein